jgi:hypothetical protein
MKKTFKKIGITLLYLLSTIIVIPFKIMLNEKLNQNFFEVLKNIWMSKQKMTVEQQCSMLYSFMKKYIPRSWKESISSVDYVPFLLQDEMKNLLEKGIVPDSINKKWYYKEALDEFLKIN